VTHGSLFDASWLVTDRMAGASQGAFGMGNLALHVGDDPQAVSANRAALARSLGVPAVVFGRAAHSDQVAYVEKAGDDIPGVDALITDRPDLGLAAQGADCVMLAVATSDGWIAAIHCGWKGLVAGVVTRTLQTLVAAGAQVSGAQAHLGPSICPQCYRVDGQRAGQVRALIPEAVRGDGASFGLDLALGVRRQLSDYGMTVSTDPRCTAQDPALYSYRRDHVTGRQAIAIARRTT
jgi:YfiH family protein